MDTYCKEVVRRIAAAGLMAMSAGSDAPGEGTGGSVQGALDEPYIVNTEDGHQVGAPYCVSLLSDEPPRDSSKSRFPSNVPTDDAISPANNRSTTAIGHKLPEVGSLII